MYIDRYVSIRNIVVINDHTKIESVRSYNVDFLVTRLQNGKTLSNWSVCVKIITLNNLPLSVFNNIIIYYR